MMRPALAAAPPDVRPDRGVGALLLWLAVALAGCQSTPLDAPSSPSSALVRAVNPDVVPEAVSATRLEAFHRSGQTFLTWPEDTSVAGETYRLYRASSPISSSNLPSATFVATVSEDSSKYTNEVSSGNPYQTRYIIQDLGPEVPVGVGLFVHTTAETGPVTRYYAVTVVKNGVEQPLQSLLTLTGAITEQKALPAPVMVYTNGLKTLYTHWMNYSSWNPVFEGYAYNFWVGVPKTGNTTVLPMQMHLHAWGESWQRNWYTGDSYGSGSPYNLPVVWVQPDDARNTWWYGYANNVTRGVAPTSSSIIVNYTEQRLLYLLEWISGPSSPYRIDRERMFLYGGSMGGGGTLTFGLRHPEWFAGLYALIAMSDEASSTWGRSSLDGLWGTLAQNLPTNEGIGVHDRLDMQSYLIDNAGEDLPYTVSFHGRTDTTIEWWSQGLPWVDARDMALLPGPVLWADSDHYSSFDIYFKDLFSNYHMDEYTLRHDESYLVFSNGPADDDPESATPSCRGSAPYNYAFLGNTVEWSGAGRTFLGMSSPVDTPTEYRVGLRIRSDVCNMPSSGTTTVTLRRLQAFDPGPSSLITWTVYSAEGTLLQSGTTTRGTDGRLTVTGVPVRQSGVVFTLTMSGGTSPDADRDGVTVAQGDCNDADASIYPGATEVCDGRDQDCDGQVDEGALTTFYQDRDGDGYGGTTTTQACSVSQGYSALSGDCDDQNANTWPGAPEQPDDQDNDCDGTIDEGTGITLTWVLSSDTGLKDTFIRRTNDGNYGSAEFLVTYSTIEPDYRSLLWFDLNEIDVPVDATLVSARLVLSCYRLLGPSQTSPVNVYRLTRSWIEGSGSYGNTRDGASWTTWDGSRLWTTAGGDIDRTTDFGKGANGLVANTSAVVGTVALEVAPLVQRWLDGRMANDGLVLTPPPGTFYTGALFNSADGAEADTAPYLELQFTRD